MNIPQRHYANLDDLKVDEEEEIEQDLELRQGERNDEIVPVAQLIKFDDSRLEEEAEIVLPANASIVERMRVSEDIEEFCKPGSDSDSEEGVDAGTDLDEEQIRRLVRLRHDVPTETHNHGTDRDEPEQMNHKAIVQAGDDERDQHNQLYTRGVIDTKCDLDDGLSEKYSRIKYELEDNEKTVHFKEDSTHINEYDEVIDAESIKSESPTRPEAQTYVEKWEKDPINTKREPVTSDEVYGEFTNQKQNLEQQREKKKADDVLISPVLAPKYSDHQTNNLEEDQESSATASSNTQNLRDKFQRLEESSRQSPLRHTQIQHQPVAKEVSKTEHVNLPAESHTPVASVRTYPQKDDIALVASSIEHSGKRFI